MGSRHWGWASGCPFLFMEKATDKRHEAARILEALPVGGVPRNGWMDRRRTTDAGTRRREGSTVVANSLSTLSSPPFDLSATRRRWDYESPRPSWKHDGSVLHGRQIYLSDHPPAGETCLCVCVFLWFFFSMSRTETDPFAPPPRHRLLLRASVRGAGGRGDRVSWEGGRGRGVRLTASWSAPVRPPPPPSLITRGHVSPVGMGTCNGVRPWLLSIMAISLAREWVDVVE